MSLKRWAVRRDATEPDIVKALRRVGAKVQICSDKGLCDLVVLFRGKVFLLECKSRLGRATLAQDERMAEGWPYTTVRDEKGALKAIGAIR